MNKKELAAIQMKQRVIEKTIELFGTKGPIEFSAAMLSKEVGASKGALYHHFENLDAVKLAALQSLIDSFMYTGAEEKPSYPSLEAYLTDIGEQVFYLMEQEPVKVKAMLAFVQQAVFEPVFQEKVRKLFQHSLAQYSEVVRYLFPDLSDKQITAAVQIIDAHLGGTMLHWYLLNTPEQCRENWRSFCRIFCNSIAQGVV
ncbi:TetR/AcrR family transcriptional regulator [Corallincola platygyrae]|uniref:TetR/AcrR family transcriptional regulator n=1 Tax=Corallincola platygyrae TaxID=1193278 RepID=A0ABW4XP75_9GAMM